MSSSATDPFLNDLLAALCAAEPRVEELRRRIQQLATDDEAPGNVVLRYFALYTVPLLEAAGFFSDSSHDHVEIPAAHLSLGLYVRYADYVIDRDRPAEVIDDSRHALRHLLRAQSLLSAAGTPWSDLQSAVLIQYLDYEREVSAGFRHDLASLWRRVSPLCVVGDTVLRWPAAASQAYRLFLAWSLMQADCDDIFEDLRANRLTPVTRQIGDHLSGTAADAESVAATMKSLRQYLEAETERLLAILHAHHWPLWSLIVQRLAEVFCSHTK